MVFISVSANSAAMHPSKPAENGMYEYGDIVDLLS